MAKPKFTMASELIKELQELTKNGDLPVAIPTEQGFASCAIVYTDEYYYDGGYVAPDEDNPRNWLTSKVRDDKGMGHCAPGFPHNFIRLYSRWPGNDGDKLNGRRLRDIVPEEWDWYEAKELEEKNLFDGELVKYRGSKEKDPKLGCYPYIAYLDSGLEAVGDGNCKTAKETLVLKYQALKKLRSGELTVQVALTSPERAEREAARYYLDNL